MDFAVLKKYTRTIADSDFMPPKGVVCKVPAPPKPWTHATDCAPACATGTLCCKDDVKDNGTCFKVKECKQITGSSSEVLPAWSSYADAFNAFPELLVTNESN